MDSYPSIHSSTVQGVGSLKNHFMVGQSSSSHIYHHHHHQYITMSNNKLKHTTKHLAALGFLSNIPMKKEASIRETGLNNISRTRAYEENDGQGSVSDDSVDEANENKVDSMQTTLVLNTMVDSVGIKLMGPLTYTVRYPSQFRYSFSQISDLSAVVRQWEEHLLKKNNKSSLVAGKSAHAAGSKRQEAGSGPSLLAARLFSSRQTNYPTMIFSIIKYDAGEERAKINKLKAEDHRGGEVFDLPKRDWRGHSYKKLFKASGPHASSGGEDKGGLEQRGDVFSEKGFAFDPNFIDDPDLLHGSHRYVLQRSGRTGPIISSIILFVNKKELKDSLNEQFREKHPNLPPSLTLSKIRNLKKQALLTCYSIGFELATVAIAMINFERLCMKGLVTKFNRRLSMATCLILAVKFNESLNACYHDKIGRLYHFFDRDWNLPKKVVFEAEFGAFVQLNFSLHVPYPHVHLMYTRLLKLLNKSSKQYLGDDMSDLYASDLINHMRAAARASV